MKPTMIRSIEDWQAVLLSGERDWKQYGEVNAIYHNDLVLFNYTQAAQYLGRWNWFELNARGLIMNVNTAEVVARPFQKFFNYGQRLPWPGTFIVEVTEKMDGSLGILYRVDGQYKIATRGSLTGSQAQWATAYLNTHHDLAGLPDDLTLLFEIIYPENRVVVDYGDFTGLVLIGARNRFYGQELYAAELDVIAAEYGFMRPKTYSFRDLNEIIDAAEALTANTEGWVLRYSNNERFKIKGTAYQLAHRIMTGATFNRVLDAVAQGQFDAMIEGIPDEFLGQVRTWKGEIDAKVAAIQAQIDEALARAPQGSQKEFALWVQTNYPAEFHAYLFAAKGGKPIEPLAYKYAFRDRADADVALVVDET